MLVITFVSWWYTTGWLSLFSRVGTRLETVLDFFSIPLLLGSLFAPFRQISAGRVQGSLSLQLQAFGDRLFSRFIGAIVRTLLIVAGTIILLLSAIFYLALIIAWPIVPFTPLIGVVLMTMGVAYGAGS